MGKLVKYLADVCSGSSDAAVKKYDKVTYKSGVVYILCKS